jgi:hypothetical protein
MRIGDETITRDQMPAMQAWMVNPDHLRQSIQDVLNVNLNKGLGMPQQIPGQGTAENNQSQWNGGTQ